MFNVSTFKFAIYENVMWDIVSNSKQKFSSKKEVHHADV